MMKILEQIMKLDVIILIAFLILGPDKSHRQTSSDFHNLMRCTLDQPLGIGSCLSTFFVRPSPKLRAIDLLPCGFRFTPWFLRVTLPADPSLATFISLLPCIGLCMVWVQNSLIAYLYCSLDLDKFP